MAPSLRPATVSSVCPRTGAFCLPCASKTTVIGSAERRVSGSTAVRRQTVPVCALSPSCSFALWPSGTVSVTPFTKNIAGSVSAALSAKLSPAITRQVPLSAVPAVREVMTVWDTVSWCFSAVTWAA